MISNPKFIECIYNIENGYKVLQNIDIKYNKEFVFKNNGSVFYFEPECKKFDHIATFDLDWTLSYNENHLFPKDVDDIHIFPQRRHIREDIIKLGYNIVIFTNQYAKSKNEKLKKVERVKTFLKNINLPIYVYIATEKDENRKPNIGMWNMFIKNRPTPNKLIFVGDALGRPQDFSDSDRLFGEGICAKIYSPEDFFGEAPVPSFKDEKELVIFVGMPGSGKSTYYSKYLNDHIHIEQDKLGSRAKVLKLLDKSLESGKSIVIDSTNTKQENRLEFYEKAINYGYTIKVLYFLINGTGFNKLRSFPVPDIAYHIYFKNLDPPTYENTPGDLIYIY